MDSYVQLARESFAYYVKTGRFMMDQEKIPQELKSRRSGVFITILKDGRERGAAGKALPVHANVADEIIETTVFAGCYDMRYDRVQEEELDQLRYRVDILGQPEYVSSLAELDPAVYGIIVSNANMCRSLALPGIVAGETPDEQLARAIGGTEIIPGEEVQIERFTVERHEG